jgi:CheY-like chemotaxis protein
MNLGYTKEQFKRTGEAMEAEEKKFVLVVHDAPANIQVVNSILKDAYRIRVATNGPKALELAKACRHRT